MRTKRAFALLVVVCLLTVPITVLAQDAANQQPPGVVMETLCDQSEIPPEDIPEGTDHLALTRSDDAPGASGEIGSSAPHEFAWVQLVYQGEVTATDNSGVRIWRSTGEIENRDAGEEYTQRQGDVLLLHKGTGGGAFTVGAEEEFAALQVGLGNSLSAAEPVVMPEGTTFTVYDVIWLSTEEQAEWLDGPIGVRWERVTLEPGARLTLQDAPEWGAFLYLDSGILTWGFVKAGSNGNPGSPVTINAGQTIPAWSFAGNLDLVIDNTGDQPAVLYRAVVTQADASSATSEGT